jgi:phosphoribosylformimino-5-aminoimidazole carboxamide ribotide isomerase
MLGGLNIAQTTGLADQISTPVIASGGVGDIGDIRALRDARNPGISGVIIGRALYDGRINPGEVLTLLGT